MELTFIGGEEDTGGLANVVSTNGAPSDLGGISLVENFNEIAIDLDASVGLLDSAGESSVDGIVFQQVDEIVEVHERIVDSSDSSLILVADEGGSEDESTDSAKSIDTHSYVTHSSL
jgi:hypothetical protein